MRRQKLQELRRSREGEIAEARRRKEQEEKEKVLLTVSTTEDDESGADLTSPRRETMVDQWSSLQTLTQLQADIHPKKNDDGDRKEKKDSPKAKESPERKEIPKKQESPQEKANSEEKECVDDGQRLDEKKQSLPSKSPVSVSPLLQRLRRSPRRFKRSVGNRGSQAESATRKESLNVEVETQLQPPDTMSPAPSTPTAIDSPSSKKRFFGDLETPTSGDDEESSRGNAQDRFSPGENPTPPSPRAVASPRSKHHVAGEQDLRNDKSGQKMQPKQRIRGQNRGRRRYDHSPPLSPRFHQQKRSARVSQPESQQAYQTNFIPQNQQMTPKIDPQGRNGGRQEAELFSSPEERKQYPSVVVASGRNPQVSPMSSVFGEVADEGMMGMIPPPPPPPARTEQHSMHQLSPEAMVGQQSEQITSMMRGGKKRRPKRQHEAQRARQAPEASKHYSRTAEATPALIKAENQDSPGLCAEDMMLIAAPPPPPPPSARRSHREPHETGDVMSKVTSEPPHQTSHAMTNTFASYLAAPPPPPPPPPPPRPSPRTVRKKQAENAPGLRFASGGRQRVVHESRSNGSGKVQGENPWANFVQPESESSLVTPQERSETMFSNGRVTTEDIARQLQGLPPPPPPPTPPPVHHRHSSNQANKPEPENATSVHPKQEPQSKHEMEQPLSPGRRLVEILGENLVDAAGQPSPEANLKQAECIAESGTMEQKADLRSNGERDAKEKTDRDQGKPAVQEPIDAVILSRLPYADLDKDTTIKPPATEMKEDTEENTKGASNAGGVPTDVASQADVEADTVSPPCDADLVGEVVSKTSMVEVADEVRGSDDAETEEKKDDTDSFVDYFASEANGLTETGEALPSVLAVDLFMEPSVSKDQENISSRVMPEEQCSTAQDGSTFVDYEEPEEKKDDVELKMPSTKADQETNQGGEFDLFTALAEKATETVTEEALDVDGRSERKKVATAVSEPWAPSKVRKAATKSTAETAKSTRESQTVIDPRNISSGNNSRQRGQRSFDREHGSLAQTTISTFSGSEDQSVMVRVRSERTNQVYSQTPWDVRWNRIRDAVKGKGNPTPISGVSAARAMVRWSRHTRSARNTVMAMTHHWKLSYEDRTKDHQGYFPVDIFSLCDTSFFNVEPHALDNIAWEDRDVKQRFLFEKDMSFSRNWFGDLLRKRGNDRYREPVCRPQSMLMHNQVNPVRPTQNKEWYSLWQMQNNGFKSDDSSDSHSTTSEFSSTDGGTTEYTYSVDDTRTGSDGGSSTYYSEEEDEEEDEEERADEEEPECGTLRNVRQKIGEHVTRVTPTITTSLRQSRFRKKWFPRGTFPY